MAIQLEMNRSNYVGVETGRRFMTEEQLRHFADLTGGDYQELYDAHERWELLKKEEVAQKIVEKAKYLPFEKLEKLLYTLAPEALEPLFEKIIIDYNKEPEGMDNSPVHAIKEAINKLPEEEKIHLLAELQFGLSPEEWGQVQNKVNGRGGLASQEFFETGRRIIPSP